MTRVKETWIAGLSGRPHGKAPRGTTLLDLIRAVGEERVRFGAEAEGAHSMTRREVLARVLWTRAIAEGDTASVKLLIECLEGRLSKGQEAERALLNADELAAAEQRLREWLTGHARGEEVK